MNDDQTVVKSANDDAQSDVSVQIAGDTQTGTHKNRKYIIEYNRDACIGAASCAAIAPFTFGMDDENKAFLIDEGEWDDEELILAAAQSCPVLAIIIKDAATGEQIFPEL